MGLVLHKRGVKNQYFVRLKGRYVFGGSEESVDPLSFRQMANALATEYGGVVSYIYYPVLNAFAISVDMVGAEQLSRDLRVEMVEQDTRVVPPRRPKFTGFKRLSLAVRNLFVPRINWALDRINQESPALDNNSTRANKGKGVRVYVLDTGVDDPENTIFGGRLVDPGHSVFPPGTTDTADRGNHGTSVAALIGGTIVGVAPEVEIFPVRVWSGTSGSACSIAAGVTWVAQQKVFPAVANISLEAELSQSLNDAVEAAQSVIQFVVSAGNDGKEVDSVSPASSPNAITVGGSTLRKGKDEIAADSNFGGLVDIFAPGEDVESVSSAGVPRLYSGTSMAAALVSGALAIYLHDHSSDQPPALRASLIKASSKQKIFDAKGASYNLLYVNF